MHSFTLLAAVAALFAVTISATPTPKSPPYPILRPRAITPEECPCEDDVSFITNGFGQLVSNFNSTLAGDILAADFHDYSDSISFLMGKAPTTPQAATFTSLDDFDVGSAGQPTVPFSIVETIQQCKKVVIRWVAYPGSEPSRGFTLMHLHQGNGTANGWQITEQFAEFNVAAWANDISSGTCNSPPPPPSAEVPVSSVAAAPAVSATAAAIGN